MDSAQTHIARSRSRPADKAFRVFDPGRGLLSPASLDDWLPAEHLARFMELSFDGFPFRYLRGLSWLTRLMRRFAFRRLIALA